VGVLLSSPDPVGITPEEVRALAPYTVVLALALGLGMATIYRVSARWMGLPSWEEFAAEADYDPEW
jgi:hypothetical protein